MVQCESGHPADLMATKISGFESNRKCLGSNEVIVDSWSIEN